MNAVGELLFNELTSCSLSVLCLSACYLPCRSFSLPLKLKHNGGIYIFAYYYKIIIISHTQVMPARLCIFGLYGAIQLLSLLLLKDFLRKLCSLMQLNLLMVWMLCLLLKQPLQCTE